MITLSIIAILLLISAVMFYLSWSISLGFYLRSICHNRQCKDSVALTYDDGVDPELTPQLLDILDQHKVKASFFIIGDKARLYPDIVRDIAHRGHTIGNHSMCHKGSFPSRRGDTILREIEECREVLESIIGKKIKYFRPPFGVTTPMVGDAVRRSKLVSVGWSIRSYDTMGHEVDTVERRIKKRIKGGDIILMHDNRESVLDLTDRVLKYINESGYRAVSIDELLKNRE